ncbi:MAG: hypothetical protein U1F04_10375 [Burkholderiaceae bacterium]|jgi:hypothetical protein
MKLPRPRIPLSLAAWLLAAISAGAQPAPAPWQWRSDDLALRGNLQAQTWSYSMRGAWWYLAATSAPTFDRDRSFGELWLNPVLSGTYGLSGAGEVYGGLSVGFSKTLPSDFFDYRNAGEALLENAFVGLRGKTGEGLGCDVSVGRQSFSWRRRTILETRAHQSGIAKPKARQATTATAISEIAVFLLRPSADQ